MRKAEAGSNWVATWKTQVDEYAIEGNTVQERFRNEEIVVWSVVDGHFNPQGFGAYALTQTRIPARYRSTVANVLLSVSGADLRGSALTSFIDELPLVAEVEEAAIFEQTYRTLEWLKKEAKLTFQRFPQHHDWREQIILPAEDVDYGALWVPHGKADLLVKRDNDSQLSLTHDLVDVLVTKHSLLMQLGLTQFINKDLRKIDNALNYQRQRTR